MYTETNNYLYAYLWAMQSSQLSSSACHWTVEGNEETHTCTQRNQFIDVCIKMIDYTNKSRPALLLKFNFQRLLHQPKKNAPPTLIKTFSPAFIFKINILYNPSLKAKWVDSSIKSQFQLFLTGLQWNLKYTDMVSGSYGAFVLINNWKNNLFWVTDIMSHFTESTLLNKQTIHDTSIIVTAIG